MAIQTSIATSSRPAVRSLLAATAVLDDVLLSLDLEDRLASARADVLDDLEDVALPAFDPWCARVHSALFECLAAVRDHIETIEGEDGALVHLALEEPRLISRLERLDGALNALVPRISDACAAPESQIASLVGPLTRLVSELRAAANGELEIFNEALVPIGSGD